MTEEVKKPEITPPANAAPAARPAEDIGALKTRLETLEKENSAYKLKEVVQRIAETEKVSPDLLVPLASKFTEVELVEYAKKLPKAGTIAADLKLDSNRGGGGGGQSFTRSQIADRAFYMKNKEAILQAYAEGKIKE